MSILARPVHAQAVANPDLPATAADSVFQRARQLVLSGSGAAGRLLVDSVIAANLPDTPVYADALFWRATLATDTLDAEGDFRRIIVEYPLSRHANDALLQLGESEAARGERTAASAHLERYLLENPATPERARIGLQVVKLSFDMHDAQRGCTTLGRVLRDVPADAVEMRNQLEYYQPRCAGVDTTRAEASADSVPTVVPPPLAITAKTVAPDAGAREANAHAPPPRDSARSARTSPRDSARSARTPAATGKYTLQVAAYTSRAEASALAKKLVGRGLTARVVGTKKLFRVRIGHYATRVEAAAEAKRLATKKITTFITEAGSDDR